MESAVLGGYVDHVMQLHPGAPLPGVYLADEIFKNAVQHRQRLGDEKFFEDLNQGNKAAAGSGWGKLASGWNAARFEAALEAPPSSEERTRLVGDLVQFIFPAFRGIAQGKDVASALYALDLYSFSATGVAFQQAQDETPNHTQVGRSVIAAHAAFVLSKAHVQLPVEIVLDAPMTADCRCELLDRHQPAEDVVTSLHAVSSLRVHPFRDRYSHRAEITP